MDLDFFVLKPIVDANYGILSYVASPNCNLSTYEFAAPAIICLKPPPGWVCISIKSNNQNGIGPLNLASEKLPSIKVSSNENPFWAVDIVGSRYYNILIKASLLAKHAFGMVDTSVLKSCETWSICL
jgi:hypothetical protein